MFLLSSWFLCDSHAPLGRVTDTLHVFIPHIPVLVHWCLLNYNNVRMDNIPHVVLRAILGNLPLLHPTSPAIGRLVDLLNVFVRVPDITLLWDAGDHGAPSDLSVLTEVGPGEGEATSRDEVSLLVSAADVRVWASFWQWSWESAA